MLSRLIARYEQSTSYRLEGLPADFVAENMAGTVGFQVRVNRLEASFKLSQNRDDEDYRSIILQLEARPDDLSRGVASAMRSIRSLDESQPSD
jgi:transcriptional regulator